MLDRRNLLYVFVVLTAVTAMASRNILAAEAERPNILFIFTDDQPQICMGCMGNEHIQTPNMDRLASEGVRTDDWKYLRYPEIEPPYEQLFQLKGDPREGHNLASDPAHAQTLNRLQGRCDAYRELLK
jgi:arylsulfatase A-like enzyme